MSIPCIATCSFESPTHIAAHLIALNEIFLPACLSFVLLTMSASKEQTNPLLESTFPFVSTADGDKFAARVPPFKKSCW